MKMATSLQKTQAGYKKTDIGVIPDDWDVIDLVNLSNIIDSLHQTPSFSDQGFAMVRVTDIKTGNLNLDNTSRVDEKIFIEFTKNYRPKKGDIVLSRVGSYGVSSYVNTDEPFCMGQNTVVIEPLVVNKFLYYILNSSTIKKQIENESFGTGYKSLSLKNIKELKLQVPSTKEEQSAIAQALSDTDALIESLDKLIAKKRDIKQGAMQRLLTGKKRLPGFSGKWETRTLLEITDCLDNLRVPLNDNQRLNMKGDYPYCGANGTLDFINKYMIDDDIILIAEDGGYFDEYAYRPIAYRIRGKCWVNNHAHILKAKENFSQNYIFYSLVHRNILSFLTSGTRAKLNKSEMYKIEIDIPKDKAEQTAIAQLLSDMDAEIEELEEKLDKYKMIKQGMMQELLTGRTRLI